MPMHFVDLLLVNLVESIERHKPFDLSDYTFICKISANLLAKIEIRVEQVDYAYKMEEEMFSKLQSASPKDALILYTAICCLCGVLSIGKDICYYYLDKTMIITQGGELKEYIIECVKEIGRIKSNDAGRNDSIPTKIIDSISVQVIDPDATESVNSSISQLISNKKPFIIRKYSSAWKCIEKWNDISFWNCNHGHRYVPVEHGSKYTDDNSSISIMQMSKFLNVMFEEKVYLAHCPIFDYIPQLMNDIQMPNICDGNPSINLWMGASDTISPLHYDKYNNCFVQIKGRKWFRLVDPKYSEKLYPCKDSAMANTSQVDVENVDFNDFPLFKDVPFADVVVEQGDLLYIPMMYWHFVKSLDHSISVSFWY